jgi:hypothetical protein
MPKELMRWSPVAVMARVQRPANGGFDPVTRTPRTPSAAGATARAVRHHPDRRRSRSRREGRFARGAARPPARQQHARSGRTRDDEIAGAVVVEIRDQQSRGAGRQAREWIGARQARGFETGSVRANGQPCDASIRRDTQHVDDPVAADVRGGNRGHARELARHRTFHESAAAQVEIHAQHALVVQKRGVGHAFTVEIGPDKTPDARRGAEGRLRREGPVAVVAQHHRGGVPGREDQIEIAVRIDIGRPHGVERRAGDVRGQPRLTGHRRKRRVGILMKDLDARGTGDHEIGPEVVVQIRGRDRVGSGIRQRNAPGKRDGGSAGQTQVTRSRGQ